MSLASEILARRMRLPRAQTHDVVVERDLAVPADDGVALLADRWAPRGQTGLPTVLVRSPYGRRGLVGLLYGRLFAERGFQAVVQSVRGTFGSGGELDPFNERADGLATLAWIERQPWHAGRLGMTGPSYLGIAQWAVAGVAGDAIDALAMSVTGSDVYAHAYGAGALGLETMLSWLFVVGVQERRLGPLLIATGARRKVRPLFGELPLAEIGERAAGRRLPFYADWLAHAERGDPYWTARTFSSEVADVTAPVQLVGGWYDIFLPWTLDDYARLRRAGREPQLIVGPWAHTSPALTGAAVRAALAWMRAHLLGDRRLLRDAPVQIYVTGAREWRNLPQWPPANARESRLHLQPGGALAPSPPPPSPPDRYRYDPHDPTPAYGGQVLFDARPVVDNRPLEARADVLTYTTERLERDLEAIGDVRAEIHVRSSLEHFDVFARVCDVEPSGASLNVCDGIVRIEPGRFAADADGIVRAEVPLWPAAHRFARGHRIRLQVSSGAHPRYARNTGTDEPLATATRLVASEQEVFHDERHPSAVVVSVV
jgi:uncharacterized protein